MINRYIHLKESELEFLLNNSIPTGSRLWGVGGDNSDYDMLILDKNFDKVKKSEPDCSYTCTIDGKDYHFIVKDKKGYEVWKKTTEVITTLSKLLPKGFILNRSDRLVLFITIKRIFELGKNVDAYDIIREIEEY